jgi:hypothetical protein
MATDKPRITITLSPYVYATIKRMSELGKQPMSSIVAELLDAVHEPLMRTVALLEAASEAPQQVKDGLRHSFHAVEREMYGALGYTFAQMDWLIDQLGKPPAGGAETPLRGGAAPSAGGERGGSRKSDPHVVTRGSGPPEARGSGPLEGVEVPPLRGTKTARKAAKTRVSAKGGKRA